VIWRWISPLMLLALVPIWRKRHHAPYVMTLAMILILWWTILGSRFSSISHFYYWNPIVIVMAMLGAIGGVYLIERLQALSKPYAQGIAALVIGILLVLEGSFLLSMFKIMNQPTTQQLGREWIVEHIEADSRIF